jgi:hypothetical protein
VLSLEDAFNELNWLLCLNPASEDLNSDSALLKLPKEEILA